MSVTPIDDINISKNDLKIVDDSVTPRRDFLGTQEDLAELEAAYIENIFLNFKNTSKPFNVNGWA